MPIKVALYNSLEKRKVEVDPEQATALLRDPAFQIYDDQTLTLVDPWGAKFATRGSEVYKYIRDPQYRLETASEEHQRYLDENYGGVGGAAAAGIVGAARGATLGLTDLAANALGAGEVIADLAEAHPVVSTVGEVAGGVAGALAAGGVGVAGLGRTAATALARTPAGLAVQSGKAAALAVEKALRGASVGERAAVLIGKAAGGAAEGAMFGGGAAMSEALLGDPDAAGVDILADLAKGAAFGATVDGALGFALGLPAFAKRASKLGMLSDEAIPATDIDTENLRSLLSEVTGRDLSPAAVGTWQKLTAKMQATAGRLLRGGKGGPQAAAIHEKLLLDPIRRAAATMDDAFDRAFDDVLPVWREARDSLEKALKTDGPVKAERVARIAEEAKDMSTAAARAKYSSVLTAVRRVARNVGREAQAADHKVVAREMKRFLREISEHEYQLIEALPLSREPRSGAVVMQHLDRLGETINRTLARKWQRTKEFYEQPDYLEALKGARHEIVGALTDENFFGKAAVRMAELRQAADKALRFEHQVNKRFLREKVSDALGTRYELDPKRVKTIVKQLGDDPEFNTDVRNLREYFTGSLHQLETNKALLNLEGAERAAYDKAIGDVGKLLKRFDGWHQVAKERADFKALSRVGGFNALGIGDAGNVTKLWSSLGFATGATSGPASIGLWVLGSAVGALSRPAQYIQRIDQLAASRRRVAGQIESAVSGLVRTGAAARGPLVGQVVSSDRRDTRELQARRSDDLREVLGALQQVAAGGDLAVVQLKQRYPSLADMAPQTVQAMVQAQVRGAGFLVQRASQLGIEFVPGRFRDPPATATATWWSEFGAVNDPIGHILEPLSRGQLSPAAERVLKNVYPTLREGIQDAVWKQLENQPVLTPSTAQTLSRILGIPIDGALSLDVVAVIQNAQRVLNPSENPNVAGSGRPASVESNPLTTAQRLASK